MGGELVKAASLPSYTEQMYEHFPYYLSLGMTASQYWDGDCTLVKYYRKADKIKSDRENHNLWLQGCYIYEALCCVSPVLNAFAKSGTKPIPYSEKPYSLTKEEQERRNEEKDKKNRDKARAVFTSWADTFKNKVEGGSEKHI